MNVIVFRRSSPILEQARSRRPLLLARWRRAADGVLECRWECVPQR